MIADRAGQFFINGEWVNADGRATLDVINPATEKPVCSIAMGTEADVDKAVAAARAAFPSYSQTTPADRIELLNNIVSAYKARFSEMGETISMEMGAPITFATRFQAGAGMGHYKTAAKVLETFHFHEDRGSTAIVREPIGCDWYDHALELAVEPDLLQGRSSAGFRLYYGSQAIRSGAAVGPVAGRDHG